MKFEWDAKKTDINLKKHAVSFNEARTVFDDLLACIFDDKWSSFGEQREPIIGNSNDKRLLIVFSWRVHPPQLQLAAESLSL